MFTVLAAAAATLRAQSAELGLYAGLDVAGAVSSDNMAMAARNGFVFGGTLSLPLAPPAVRLTVGAQYVNKGVRIAAGPEIGIGDVSSLYSMNYLEIPVNVKIAVGGAFKVYALAGANVGTVLSATQQLTGEGTSEATEAGGFAMALEAGGGISYAITPGMALTADARYSYEITEQSCGGTQLTAPQQWQPRDLKITTGILFRL